MIRVLSMSLTLLLLAALTVTVLETFAAPETPYELQVQRGAKDRPDQGLPAPRSTMDRPDQGAPAPRGEDIQAPRLDFVTPVSSKSYELRSIKTV